MKSRLYSNVLRRGLRVGAEGTTPASLHPRVLTLSTVNERIINFEYAVRGRLVLRAQELEKNLTSNPTSLPFKRITYCNIGNPQQLGQKPLTFIRQVVSLVEYPSLLEKVGIEHIYPKDALQRAKEILKYGGTGAYSESQGRYHVRHDVASFINRRDGRREDDYSYSSPDNVFLTEGASAGVQTTLKLLIRNEKDGIMIPIPQYPLYSATIPILGGRIIPYYLDESRNWGLDVKELKISLNKAKSEGVVTRALVVINPGNPTGSCLTESNIGEIIQFCHDENLLIMSDEVYQENVYVPHKPFVSFKKKLYDLGEKYRQQELVSYHSTSKGILGECGKRGGYFELTNIDSDVKQLFYKTLSVLLCPNIIGQIVLSLMVSPPRPGDPSYELYMKERTEIYESLKKRALLVSDTLNTLPGITCVPPEGAMYAFPKIELPSKVIELAKVENVEPDMFYCWKLLDETGLCVVPGSGFGQREGEFHFRTTFLPKTEHIQEVLQSFKEFHLRFLKTYK